MIGNQKIKQIIGFGDSLTWGYYQKGVGQNPYSLHLNELLKKNSKPFRAENFGVNGEITMDMGTRLKSFFDDVPDKSVIHLVLLFGGTNDIGYQFDCEEITENLSKMSDYLGNLSINHFIFTLPENKCDVRSKKLSTMRNFLNEFIRNICNRNKFVRVLDIDKEIKYSKMTKEEQEKYWDDDLHFSKLGYDMLGEIIYKNIEQYL